MNPAPWRSLLARALHRNRALPNARYVQLATVRADGLPANRTIVFRGFVPEQDGLQFVSDRRSAKMDQIRHQNMTELCWYFPKTREQFRLLGPLTLIQAETLEASQQQLRQRLWQSLSDAARQQFIWPAPGHKRAAINAFKDEPPDISQPTTNFCALIIAVTQVDHLELRGDPQTRQLYQLDSEGQWSVTEVNP